MGERTDKPETNPSNHPFQTELDPSNNEGLLNKRLDTLGERYSYECLSDLSARRLGAIDQDDDGKTERDFLNQDFRRLYKRFPDENSDHRMRRLALGDDYQGLAPLTLEQRQRIEDCHHKCSRDLDRARQDALERQDLAGPLSRFAAWLTEFADAATPVFGFMR